MPYNPDVLHRRSLRLPLADYSKEGGFFVTLCTFGREPLLGCIEDGRPVLTDAGSLVCVTWERLPQSLPHVELDEFVVMPNHLHAILWLRPSSLSQSATAQAGAASFQGPRGTVPGSLGAVIQSFKSVTSRRYNRMAPLGATLWQRNYYEHAVRDDADLGRIREYIAANPENWAQDENNVRGPASGS